MNRRTKRELGEYGKILASMAVGAFFLLAAMVAWMVDGGCFVKKADAERGRYWDSVYSMIAVGGNEE